MTAWTRSLSCTIVACALVFGPLASEGQAQEPRQTTRSDDRAGEDLTPPPNLKPFQHALFLSTRRGAEWLWNANRPDGSFLPGIRPAVDAELEDHLLRQLQGAYGLARCARFFGSERYAVRARQAALTLLALTRTDPQEATVRFTVPPSTQTNRVTAAALLMLTIAEIPEAGADLTDQAEQLANYLKKHQQRDGSFRPGDLSAESRLSETETQICSAWAVLALARSHAHKADPAKLKAARSGFDQAWRAWQQNKDASLACLLTCAGAELFAATSDKALADATCEMADWLCSLQYGSDPRRLAWQGGFRMAGSVSASSSDGEPTVDSARCVEALAEACRIARAGADLQRFGRYRDACERGLQFLSTIQYGPANTRHFAEWYGPRLYGAFRASPQDGTVALEAAQQALCALTAYFRHVIQVGPGDRATERLPGG